MEKASNSILMAKILSDGYVHKMDDIAKELNTNPRNVREYKKVLKEAGVDVRYKLGRYGGYYIGPDSTTLIIGKEDIKGEN